MTQDLAAKRAERITSSRGGHANASAEQAKKARRYWAQFTPEERHDAATSHSRYGIMLA